MILKSEKERLCLLVRETLTHLCKNGLPYKSEFSVEALVGITLDKKDVLLVSVNESVSGRNPGKFFPMIRAKQTARRGRGSKSFGAGRGRGIKRAKPLNSDEEMPAGESLDDSVTFEVTLDCDQDQPEVKTEFPTPEKQSDGFSSGMESDVGSFPDISTSEEEDSDDNPESMPQLLEKMKTDIAPEVKDKSAVSPQSLQMKAIEAGLLAGYQQAMYVGAKKQRSRSRTKTVAAAEPQVKLIEPKLCPMQPDETERIWQQASIIKREQKAPKKSPKKKSKDDDEKSEADKSDKPDHPDAPPMCHICGKTMSTEKNLTKHVRRHLGMFSIYCDECGKGFFDKTDHDAHAAKHANRKLYQCHVCGRSYSHNRGLLKHMRKDHAGTLTGESDAAKLLQQQHQQHQQQQAAESLPDPEAGTAAANVPMISPQHQQQQQQQQPSQQQQNQQPPQQSHPIQPMTSASSSDLQSLTTQTLAQLDHNTQLPHPSMLGTPAHLSHLRPDLPMPFPPGMPPLGDQGTPYYFPAPYSSQSVFPGGPGN